MEWSIPKIIAGFVATGVLLLVYAQLFALHRRKALALWTAAWFCYAVRNLLVIGLPSDFSSGDMLVRAFSLLAAAGAYLLLWGSLVFLDSAAKAPRWPVMAMAGGFLFALIAQTFGLPHKIIIAPACIAVGLTYAAAGLRLLQAGHLEPWPRFAAGAALVFWGLVQQILVTILITPTPETMAWGLLSGTACEVFTAIFLLVAFYQQMHHNLRRSQDELISQQERLEAALGNLPIAVYAFDWQGRPGLWNRAAAKLTGYRATEFRDMGQAIKQMFDLQDQRVLGLDESNLSRGVPLTLARKNGETRHIILHAMGATAPLEGWPEWGAVQDVTRQKMAERELYRQLDFSNAVLDSTTTLTMVIDARGRIVFFNKASEKATGHSMEKLVGLYALDCLVPPERRQRAKNYISSLNTMQFPNERLSQLLTKDGGRISIQWSANAIRDDSGGVEFVVVSGVDVTEQLKAEAALRRSEQFHRGVLENMPGGMLIFDYPRKDIVYINPAASGLLGFSGPQDPSQGKLQDWACTKMGKLALIIEDLEPGQTIRTRDVALLTTSGRPMHCDVSASVVEIEGSHKIICFLRDSSRRDAARERIRQATASVTHNFNNLLMAITGNAQALEDLMQSRQASRREIKLLGNVARAASNGQDMVKRLEAFLVSGVQDNTGREVLPLAEVVHTALDLVEATTKHERSRFIAADLPDSLWTNGHRGELVDVFLNLLSNAIEASGKNGEIEIAGVVEQGMACIRVADNGPGIDPENLPRLFEPFFSTKGVRGKGLGLASCKGVIMAHGGSIEAQNRQEGGAVFTVRLPLAEPRPRPQAEARPRGNGRPRTVLLVEDEALVAMGAEAVLTQAGHNVRHAANVAQARLALKRQWPDVVICDQGLPDGSAWDVARAMKNNGADQHKHTPFVVVTGWSLDSVGMVPPPDIPKPDMIIRKPVERGELLRAVEKD